ncbi:hypothetical protein [Clostridium sporogenes]
MEENKYPTIIRVHGGAFVGGDKEQVDIFATTLASNGYVVLSMNYVTKDFPPSFITYGNTSSFESHGKELNKKFQQNNVEIQTLFFPKKQYITEHEYQFKLDTEPGFKALQDSISFLKRHTK